MYLPTLKIAVFLDFNTIMIFCCRSWLDKYPQLLSMCVYTYLRVMVDHNGQMYHTLRTREAEFIASILRERVRKNLLCLDVSI